MWPEDCYVFKHTPTREVRDRLIDEFLSGCVGICVTHDSKMFLRPKHVMNRDDIMVEGKGVCIFLELRGCAMDFNDKPLMCRIIEPRKDFKCWRPEGYTQGICAESWEPYEGIIRSILDD